jgi:tRNA A-37 threonylcarbamoyl transferase component Bud32
MVGKYINNYLIDEIIDEGGMSIVYLGIHRDLKRKAAIKMLNPVLCKNPQYKKRFLNEARLLSRLNHQNIITLYDYVENDDGIFLVTEYVNGQTLDEYVDLVSGPMPETKAVKIIAQILDAIGFMHTKNMIHRDVKPSNIMIKPDNTIKLIDFGIAKHLQPNQALITQDGSKLGTAIFMSPQQVKGKVLDRRTDIYSIGATLFYLLTGQYPYDKSMSDFEIYNKIVNEPFPDPHTIYTGVSDKMKLIINKATQNQPLERYQACDEFSIALLGSQQKRSKAATVSLQTKILEASEIDISKPVFGREFWQNTVMLLAAIGFTAIIATGLYFLTKKDERQIIDNNAYLLAADSLNAFKIEPLHYGETVKIITKPEDRAINKPWFKVRSLRNNTGYVYAENLEVEHIFRQINEIFGNSNSGSLIPAKYKKMLREYYLDNRFYNDNATNMKVYAEENDAYELNYIAFGNYDGNSIQDFACIIRNIKSEDRQMVMFFDSGENISVKLTENVKIRTITAGSSGGRWYLGNTASNTGETGLPTESKKYEYLTIDGILLFKPDGNENVVYIYSPEEKMIKFYSQ